MLIGRIKVKFTKKKRYYFIQVSPLKMNKTSCGTSKMLSQHLFRLNYRAKEHRLCINFLHINIYIKLAQQSKENRPWIISEIFEGKRKTIRYQFSVGGRWKRQREETSVLLEPRNPFSDWKETNPAIFSSSSERSPQDRIAKLSRSA